MLQNYGISAGFRHTDGFKYEYMVNLYKNWYNLLVHIEASFFFLKWGSINEVNLL